MDHQNYCQKPLYNENTESESDNNVINHDGSDNESELFDAQLIKKIRSHPCIYDNRYKKNKENKNVVSEAWHQISVELDETG